MEDDKTKGVRERGEWRMRAVEEVKRQNKERGEKRIKEGEDVRVCDGAVPALSSMC